MGLVGQGLVGHPVVQGRTPTKAFQEEALPIERHAGSFKEVEVWDTFVKGDRMCKSCKNVRS